MEMMADAYYRTRQRLSLLRNSHVGVCNKKHSVFIAQNAKAYHLRFLHNYHLKKTNCYGLYKVLVVHIPNQTILLE